MNPGDYLEDKRDGYGELSYLTKEIYKGMWKEGKQLSERVIDREGMDDYSAINDSGKFQIE